MQKPLRNETAVARICEAAILLPSSLQHVHYRERRKLLFHHFVSSSTCGFCVLLMCAIFPLIFNKHFKIFNDGNLSLYHFSPPDCLNMLLKKQDLQEGGKLSMCKWPILQGSPKDAFSSCGDQNVDSRKR